jgi:hypothetical protein
MAGRKLRNQDDATECLAAAATSGLERSVWARQAGVDSRSLNMWRLNLQRRSGALPRVVELLLPAVQTSDAGCRIRRGEFVIEVDRGFDEAVLARVLTVVASC